MELTSAIFQIDQNQFQEIKISVEVHDQRNVVQIYENSSTMNKWYSKLIIHTLKEEEVNKTC